MVGIPSMFLTPTNVIIATLVVAGGIATGAAYYYHDRSELLSGVNDNLQQTMKQYVALHNDQVDTLKKVIDGQNTSIDQFEATSDRQMTEMVSVKTKVDQMKTLSEQQLAEARKVNLSNLTCAQSIDWLSNQSQTLNWRVVK
jgi:flagellar biosynthesis chaperone FliJ